jgi:putative protease
VKFVLELLSPAGSPEGVIAAIQNGADAVYLGFQELNANMDADNFNFDEFGRSLEYCRIRGVKAYLAMDCLAYDRELPIASQNAKEASRYGADAIIVQDLGIMRAVRQSVPNMPVHASLRMGIHNLEGVKMAAATGCTRVTLPNELSRKEIYHICRYSPIDIEVSVQGALCMSYTGQCYMSAMLGESSDNRGYCEKLCQFNYTASGHTISYPLSLKDNCLVQYLADLESIGVKAVRIEGRSNRPEYTALVTGMYSKAIRNQKNPTADEIHTLRNAFSQQGFTAGYYTDNKDSEMLGLRERDKRSDSALFTSTRKLYLNGEFQRVPIRFVGSVSSGKPVKLAAADDKKNAAVAYGPIPEQAFHKDFSLAALQTELYKTSGTPFVCLGVKGTVEPGLSVPMSVFTEMRVQLFAEILEQRKLLAPNPEGEFTPGVFGNDMFVPDLDEMNQSEPPTITVSVSRSDQLSKELLELNPKIVYIPASELNYESLILREFLENDETTVAVTLPRVIHDNEKKDIAKILKRASTLGIKDALVSNIGHIQFAKNHGMQVRGDFGLNVYNSETLYVLQKLGLLSATISFELKLLEIRSMVKPLDTEIITYGRLPLMLTESCIVRNCTEACTCDSFTGLTGKHGALFPVVADFGCRNVLLSSQKLFMADKRHNISALGLWAQRLYFTTENAIECVLVMKRYMGKSRYTPAGHTRGMYYRDVEV